MVRMFLSLLLLFVTLHVHARHHLAHVHPGFLIRRHHLCHFLMANHGLANIDLGLLSWPFAVFGLVILGASQRSRRSIKGRS